MYAASAETTGSLGSLFACIVFTSDLRICSGNVAEVALHANGAVSARPSSVNTRFGAPNDLSLKLSFNCPLV